MLCSGHSILRDKYRCRALLLDSIMLAISVWLTAMIFVEPNIGNKLTPFSFSRELWLGILAIIAFFFSVIQIRVNWKELADAHQRACDFYGKIKIECNSLIDDVDANISTEAFNKIKDMYVTAGEVNICIPESKFNNLKKAHKLKIEISKILDMKPASSIIFLKIKLWYRDNLK